MKKNYLLIIIIFTILLLVLLINTILPKQNKIVLNEEEILDYKGEKLSSIEEFRENSIKGPQYIDIDKYRLKVFGLVENELSLKYEDILNRFQKYEKVTTIYCVEGWSLKILWEGFLVRDIINEAKVKEGAKIIIFHAYDGYTTSLPIEYFYNKDILIAYKMNGVNLPPERGYPFQLVAEEKWGYKWIKWITEIEVSSDEDYRGYWEERGFSNEGDLDKSFIENPRWIYNFKKIRYVPKIIIITPINLYFIFSLNKKVENIKVIIVPSTVDGSAMLTSMVLNETSNNIYE